MKKVMNIKTWVALTAFAGTAMLSGAQSASAQAASAPSSTRFSVDLKDATLRDALELVFQAAGNPSHVIDPAASQVRIGSVSFKDQEWRDIVRSLANLNKFRFRRENGLWIVDPRSTATTRNTGFGLVTSSNFQMRDFAAVAKGAAPIRFSVETRSSRQFGGGGGQGGQGGGAGGNSTLTKPIAVDSNNPWSIIEPLHIYVGAIALFFQGATEATTESFIVPSAGFSLRTGGQLTSPQSQNGTSSLSSGGGSTGGSSTGGTSTGGTSTGGTSTSR